MTAEEAAIYCQANNVKLVWAVFNGYLRSLQDYEFYSGMFDGYEEITVEYIAEELQNWLSAALTLE